MTWKAKAFTCSVVAGAAAAAGWLTAENERSNLAAGLQAESAFEKPETTMPAHTYRGLELACHANSCDLASVFSKIR